MVRWFSVTEQGVFTPPGGPAGGAVQRRGAETLRPLSHAGGRSSVNLLAPVQTQRSHPLRPGTLKPECPQRKTHIHLFILSMSRISYF